MGKYIYAMWIGLGLAIISTILLILAINAARPYTIFIAALLISTVMAVYGISSAESLHKRNQFARINALISERDAKNDANWLLDNF